MKRLPIYLLTTLLLILAACGEGYDAGDDAVGTSPADPAAVTAERDAFVADVDRRLAAFDEEIQTIEDRLTGLDPELREEIDGALSSVAEERQDIVELRDDAMQAATYEELAETRRQIREEYRDIDALLTEARLEIIQEYPEFRTTIESEMSELQGDLDQMETRADQFEGTARTRYDSIRTDLQTQYDTFEERLETTTAETWQDTRAEMIEAWRDIRSAYYDLPDPEVDVDVRTDSEPAAQ